MWVYRSTKRWFLFLFLTKKVHNSFLRSFARALAQFSSFVNRAVNLKWRWSRYFNTLHPVPPSFRCRLWIAFGYNPITFFISFNSLVWLADVWMCRHNISFRWCSSFFATSAACDTPTLKFLVYATEPTWYGSAQIYCNVWYIDENTTATIHVTMAKNLRTQFTKVLSAILDLDYANTAQYHITAHFIQFVCEKSYVRYNCNICYEDKFMADSNDVK